MGGKHGGKSSGKGGKGYAGGKGKHRNLQQFAPPQQNLQQLEATLSSTAWRIYESILDLNVPVGKLTADWNEMLSGRGKVLVMYGVGGGVVAPNGVAASAEPVAWKQLLNECMSKRTGTALDKGAVTYSSSDAEGGYIACVSAPGLLAKEYSSEQVCPNKKTAEAAAAKSAMQSEFPQQAANAEQGVSAVAVAPQKQNNKRKAETMDNSRELEPKSILVRGVQLLLGRSMTKDDVVYNTQMLGEGSEAKFSSTVTLPQYDATLSWMSDLVDSKKAAETACAEAAFATLKPLIAPLQKEKEEQKSQMKRQKLMEFKASREDKMSGKVSSPAETAGFSNAGLM